jgi:diguanylate cyclase (GGDEF)-like protein/PAS domain S-box-containing protein
MAAVPGLKPPVWRADADGTVSKMSTSFLRGVRLRPLTYARRLYRETLVPCWSAPNVSAALAARYRARQYRAVAKQIPVSLMAHGVITIALFAAFWDTANHVVLVVSTVLLALVGVSNTISWRLGMQDELNSPVPRSTVNRLVVSHSAAAAIDAFLLAYLFSVGGESGRLIVTAVGAGLIATGGWLFAYLPQAAVPWSTIICGGCCGYLLTHYGTRYALMAGLEIFYSLVVISCVLVTARAFVAALQGETEIERQREVVDLLLHDFEQDATDWLWETDDLGRLRHVSVRLTEALQTTADELRGKPLTAVLPLATPASREHLERAFTSQRSFRDSVFAVRVGVSDRWWSLTGKPLFDEDGELEGWRGVCSDVTLAQHREIELVHLANVDSLTGIANRHRFLTELGEQFDAASPNCVLLLLDLDDFKTINDTLGHAAGDELLCATARRLGEIVGDADLLARLGGDEFAILRPGSRLDKDTFELAERARAAIRAPLLVEERSVEVRASVGICAAPEHAATVHELLSRCDLALYSAKTAGRDSVRAFESEMEHRATRRLAVLGDIRAALRREEFFLEYQPQIDLATGALTGYEALVRWQHPTRGRLAPVEFIELAEESGLIDQLGAWVLHTACHDALSFRYDTTVAVNVSARQLASTDVPALVRDALRSSGLDSSRLVVEITESILVQDGPALLSVLREVRALGVQIALDDFGTGYSSLSYLRAFPLDKLKIDRSFVMELDGTRDSPSSEIAKAIIQVAGALNLDTVAEGIETEEQLAQLQDMGCTHAQGFLIARPLAADVAATFSPRGTAPAPPPLVEISASRRARG